MTDPFSFEESIIFAGLEEAEAFLAESADHDQLVREERALQLAQQAVVVEGLIRAGIDDIRYPEADETIEERLENFRLVALFSSMKQPDEAPLTDREACMLIHAQGIVVTLIEEKSPYGRGRSFVAETKRWGQFNIVEDTTITDQDKSALLGLYDELIAVEGLDITDQALLDRMRLDQYEAYESREKSLAIHAKLEDLVKDLSQTYGEHDDYHSLKLHVHGYFISKLDSDRLDPEIADILPKLYLESAREVASSIGIPQSDLDELIAKAQSFL